MSHTFATKTDSIFKQTKDVMLSFVYRIYDYLRKLISCIRSINFYGLFTFEGIGLCFFIIGFAYFIHLLNKKFNFFRKTREVVIITFGETFIGKYFIYIRDSFNSILYSGTSIYIAGLFTKYIGKITDSALFKFFEKYFYSTFENDNNAQSSSFYSKYLEPIMIFSSITILLMILACFIFQVCTNYDLSSQTVFQSFIISCGMVMNGLYFFVKQVFLSFGYTFKK